MGPQGLKGSDGTPGYNGLPGAKGEPGQTGPSGRCTATHTYVNRHYQFQAEELLAELKCLSFIKSLMLTGPYFISLFCRSQRVPWTPRAWWYPRSHRPSWPFLNGPWLPCNPPQSDCWSSTMSRWNNADLWRIFVTLCPGQREVTWARPRSAQ